MEPEGAAAGPATGRRTTNPQTQANRLDLGVFIHPILPIQANFNPRGLIPAAPLALAVDPPPDRKSLDAIRADALLEIDGAAP